MIKRKLLIISLFILTTLSITLNYSFADFTPNALVINENSKQCAKVYIGEKCTNCTLPENWATTKKLECPKEYTFTSIETTCKPVRSPYCCTIDVEGNGGDCDDVVVNIIEAKCAFVRDIDKCESLPENWEEADENLRRGKICPSIEYDWLKEPLKCIGDTYSFNQETSNQEPMSLKTKIASYTIVALLLIIGGFFILK